MRLKKQTKLFKWMLPLVLAFLLPQVASAYDFMVDGLCYNYNEDGNSVMLTYDTSSEWGTHYANLTGSLDISESVSYNGATYSVTSIDSYAFWGCLGLTLVNIPNSVTSIGGYAFSCCTKIRSIYSKIEEPENVSYGGNIFEGISKNYCKLYVPAGTVDDYQFTAPWNDFLNIIEEGGSTTPVYGDVDGDGVVTTGDITVIYNILLGN